MNLMSNTVLVKYQNLILFNDNIVPASKIGVRASRVLTVIEVVVCIEVPIPTYTVPSPGSVIVPLGNIIFQG